MSKRLSMNFVFNFITQLLTVLTPLIISPYISRIFDVTLIGDYNYCYAIASVFGLFANMGISVYGIPIIAKCKESKEKRSKAFFELFIIKIIFALIATFLYLVLIFTIFEAKYTIYFLLLTFYILSVLLDITWFFQALEDFKIICIRTVIIKLISLIFIFIFVNDKSDINIYILINMLSLILPNFLLFYSLRKQIVYKKYNLNIKAHLKPIIELFIPGIAYTVYAMVDKMMIKLITGGTSELGYYEQAYKLAFVGVTIMSVFGTVLSTRISALKNDDEIRELHKYSYSIILIVAIPLLIGLFVLSDYFIPFYYGDGYEGSISILKVFSFLPLVMGISNFVSYQYFIPKIITKPTMIIVPSAILINILLNIIFIRYYGGFGAALATIISESFISILYLIFYFRFQNISIVLKSIYKYFISGLLTFCLIYIANLLYPCISFFTFLLYGVSIFVLFFSIVLILKDEIVLTLINKIIIKLRRKKSV